MKRKTCFIAILLCFILIVAPLTSCGEAAVSDESSAIAQTSNGNAETSSVPAETVDPDSVDNLPALDYGGETVRVLSCSRDWWKDEVSVENENGESINDAVYRRNLTVEKRLNIKIENIQVTYSGNGAVTEAIALNAASGDSLYDISFANCYMAVGSITSGYFYDLCSIDNINLEKSYWLQNLNDSISFHGHQYVASGDISLSHIRMAFCTLFNKELFTKKNVAYPYEAVENGTWTLEYQLTLLSQFYDDVDGSTTKTTEDVYGLIASAQIMSDPYWEAFEIPILQKNADGDYVYSINAEKFSGAVDLLIRLYNDTGTYNYPHESADGELVTMSKVFADGKGAMHTTLLVECEREWMRDMTDAYGIVPIPKYSESQSGYHTHLFDQYTVVSVLKTVPAEKTAMMGAFLEAMAYQSSQDTIPAYYELTLKHKYQSDPTSWKMLDIIMDNVVVDAGNLYYSVLGGPHAILGELADSGTNTSSSRLASTEKVVNAGLRKLNQNLAKLVNAG